MPFRRRDAPAHRERASRTSAVARAWVAATLLAAAMVVLSLLVALRWGPLIRLDARSTHRLHDGVVGTQWLGFFHHVSSAGQPLVSAAVLAAVAAVLALRRRWRGAGWAAASLVLTWLAGQGLKDWVERPRPTIAHQVPGWSYPSGHATQAACTAAVLVLLLAAPPARRARRVLRLALAALVCAAALLVGLSRLFVAAHFPSDVLGGYLLGTLAVVALAAAFGAPWAGVRTSRRSPAALQEARPLAVIVNPIKVDVDTLRTQVGLAAGPAGWSAPTWYQTKVDDTGGAMARSAVEAGAELVVVAGGDGTVRAVCAEMAGRGVPVGIVPAGTGNLLARNLGLPLTRDQALDAALRGRNRAVDLVRVSGDGLDETRFAVMAGMGLDAAIMEGAPDRIKRRVGWPAYVLAGLRQLSYPAVRFSISVDGAEPVHRRARTVVVGNVGTLTGGIDLLPDAQIDDGLLDVVVIAPRRVFGWVPLLWRVVSRQRRTDEQLDRFTGRSAVVAAASPTPRQLDGDTMGSGVELRAEIEPGVLLVRVPN